MSRYARFYLLIKGSRNGSMVVPPLSFHASSHTYIREERRKDVDGGGWVIESRDIRLHGLLTSATMVQLLQRRSFSVSYFTWPPFVSPISGFSPTVFG